MADDINDKTIALAITTERITANVLRDAMHTYLRGRKSYKKQYPHKPLSKGRHTMRGLKKENVELTSIEISDKNIKAFDKYARKYHVAYSLKKDKSADKPKYYVFFRAKDVDSMTAAFKEFSASILLDKKRPSLANSLRQKSILVDKAKKLTKVKNMRKEMSR